MIVHRLCGLVGGFLLVGLSLTGGTPVSGQQQSPSGSATHHPAARQASDHASVNSGSHSDGGSPRGAPTDCCHMIGCGTSSPMTGESRGTNPCVVIAQRIVTKDILKPATLALSVDTPPPKA
jgi:hypothetical protein